jgi:hypothetical protein
MPQDAPGRLPGEKSKSQACLYGCLALVVVACLLAVLAVAGGLAAWKMGGQFVQDAVEKYTDTSPRQLPRPNLTPEQANNLFSRLDAFKSALDGQDGVDTVELSGDELNTFLEYQPELRHLSEFVYLTIHEDKVGGSISYPLEQLPLPPMFGLQGRYLNGTAVFSVSLANGRLEVYVDDIMVKGERLPDEFMTLVRSENLAADWEPEMREVVRKINEIKVKDGKLTAVLKKEEE